MSTRREIADAATVTIHPDNSRTISWSDGISRTYTQEAIARMWLDAFERGHTNPLFERLTTPEERNALYKAAEEVNDQLAMLVAAGDTRLVKSEQGG